MRAKFFAVLDTNVIISAVRTPKGTCSEVLRFVAENNIIPVFDTRILDEYYKVLNYPKHNFKEDDIYDMLYLVVSKGLIIHDIEKAKEDFVDQTDIPFYEVKESSGDVSSYLVTGNQKHYPKSITTLEAAPFLALMYENDKLLERMERFYVNGINYEQSVNMLIEEKLSSSKYTRGEDVLNDVFDTKNRIINKDYFDR